MTQPPDDAGETFDRIAEVFDASRTRPWPFVQEWLESLGPLEGPLLDVGCGNGRHLALAAQLGHRGVGVDLSPRLLERARERVPHGTALVLGDTRRLPLASATASAVLAIAVLHHVPGAEGRRAAASEIARVARTGAQVLASVWALDDPEVAARARARPSGEGTSRDLLVPWRAPGGPHVDRYHRVIPLEELVDLLSGAGLGVEDATEVGANHVVRARRPERVPRDPSGRWRNP